MNVRSRAKAAQSEGNWASNWMTTLASAVITTVVMTGCSSKLPESQSERIPQNKIEEPAAEVVVPTGSSSLESVEEKPTSTSTLLPPNATPEFPNGDLANTQDMDSQEVTSKFPTSDENREPRTPEAESFSSKTSEVQVFSAPPREGPANLEFDVVTSDEIMRKEGDSWGETSLVSSDDSQTDLHSSVNSEAEEEAVLVFDSIARQGCIVRGLIRNTSDSLYARNVTVALREKEGDRESKFYWPLTIEPGENAPFEVSINWFPDRVVDIPAESEGFLPRLEPWANLEQIISANMSSRPDYRRAITLNADETEYLRLYQTGHNFLVHDERIYELEAYKQMKPYGKEYSFHSIGAISSLYPASFMANRDVEPLLSEISLYNYADIYYAPDTVAEIDEVERPPDTLEELRIFQAIVEGSEVIDLRELIPYSILEEVDTNDRLIARSFVPVNTLQRYRGEEDIDKIFIGILRPRGPITQFPNRDFMGIDATHASDIMQSMRVQQSRLWWGGVSHEAISPTRDLVEVPLNSHGSYCSADGGFTMEEWELIGQAPYYYTYPLGFIGKYDEYQSGIPPTNQIIVEVNSVLMTGNLVRGLVRNLSDKQIAKKVKVAVTSPNGDALGDEWYWPLSVQPGERAPFEITIPEHDVSVHELVFEVNAEFAEGVDLTRAFFLDIYDSGSIYGNKFAHLYASERFAGVDPGNYLDHRGIWNLPRRQYFKHEFAEVYDNASIVGDLAEADLFEFLDLYARLEVPHSHPDLDDFIRKQYIGELQAFAAILDSESRVISVRRLQPFTPVYEPANIDMPYVTVDSIPASNRWSPDAVRLLLTIPFADEVERQQGYGYQIWIGGAVEGG